MKRRNSLGLALERESGASLVEYALTIALIAVVAMVSVSAVGIQATDPLSEVALALACHGDGKCGDSVFRGK